MGQFQPKSDVRSMSASPESRRSSALPKVTRWADAVEKGLENIAEQ
jgi:hypothetical protein